MQKIFCISGLGANELAFSNLGELGFEKVLVTWLDNGMNESLEQYSQRIIEKYIITKNDVVLGLSFGGLIAQQIALKLDLKKVVLISSFRDKRDLKTLFWLGLQSKLYKLMPAIRTPFVDDIVANYLNSSTANSKPIIKQMMKSTDYRFMKWAVNQIATANQISLPNTTLLNLVGNDDRIVKQWQISNTQIIKGGSHFMVFDMADEISLQINKFLAE